MSITLNSAARNNADWKTLFVFSDGETGDPIDFTGADISIEVWDDSCKRIDASTEDGKIAIIDLGKIELSISYTEMKNLRPGTYNIGGVYYLNGEMIDLFTGSLAVQRGYASI